MNRNLVITMEECGELVQACSKVIRHGYKGRHKANLTEEIGDVLAMIQIITYDLGISQKDINKQIHKRQAKMQEMS